MKALQLLLLVSVGIALVSGRAAVEEEKRLIKTSEEDPGRWMTEGEIFELIRTKQGFMDLTDSKYAAVDHAKISNLAIPTAPRFQTRVNALIPTMNISRTEDFVRHFSSYHNRYYTSQTGRQSQLWLLSEVQASVQGYTGNVSVREVNHGYLQQSIVARFEGADADLKDELVIFGAHLDSVNSRGSSLQAPGADDNGSGSVVGLETLRIIVQAQLRFRRTVEFQWYAAEEIGLRGSQAIAEEYKGRSATVFGMLNMDVVGYHVNGIDEISVYTDNADPALVRLLRVLTEEYLEYGWRSNSCGYGCSDHASWFRNGFSAVFAGEAIDHPGMHTVTDTIENMDFDQLREFIKLAIGFVVEMAEPNSS